MTTRPDVKRDEALNQAKAEYLQEMKKLRSEYFKRRNGTENRYFMVCGGVWRRFWEDVG